MGETQVLFKMTGLRLGQFGCGPDSPRWRGENVIESRPHVVFPGTSVVIRHVGSEPVLANRNHVMFYNAGQRYRRRLHDATGDHSHFVEVAPPLLAELAGSDREVRFPFSQGPGDARLYALVAAVVRHLAHETPSRRSCSQRSRSPRRSRGRLLRRGDERAGHGPPKLVEQAGSARAFPASTGKIDVRFRARLGRRLQGARLATSVEAGRFGATSLAA